MRPRLLVIHVAWGPKTGILSFISYLARWQTQQEGLAVRLAFFDSDRAYLKSLAEMLQSDGLAGRMFRCWSTPFHRLVLWGERRLQAYVDQQAAELHAPRVVVHLHEAHLSALLLPVRAPQGTVLHPVVTFHGFPPQRIVNRRAISRMFHRYVARRLARCAPTCVSVSDAEIPPLAQSLGVPPETFTAIHNGVPQLDGVEQHRRGLGRFRVGFAGVFEERKRWWLVGEAVERARAMGADCEVVFAGGQGNVAGVTQWVRQRPEFATYLGNVPNAGACLVPTLDAVVLPSWHEGLPMLLLEAMAAGVPVIATPVGGVPEMVISGRNGFLVEPTAAAIAARIVQLCEQPALYDTLAENGIATIRQRFTMDACGRRYLELYQRGPRQARWTPMDLDPRASAPPLESSHVSGG